MDIKNRKLLLKPGFFLMVSVICFFASLKTLVLLTISSAIHEAGHMLVIALCGGEINGIEMGFCVFTIRYDERGMSYFREVIAALAGPAASFAAALIAACIWRKTGCEILIDIAEMNIILGAFNLMPLKLLDGGRAAGAITARFFGEAAAAKAGAALEFITLSVMLTLGVHIYSATGDNPSLLLLAAVLIIFSCKNSKNSVQSTLC